MTGEALDVFISYSHKDEALKEELALHLKILQREGKINTWQDRDIEAGAEWAKEIKTQLEKAHIILLLVTRNFLASDYCYETEMRRAVKRHDEGTARVIPIILSPCGWKYSDFKLLQALPRDGKPVTSWQYREEAFFDVEEGIRRVVDSLNEERLRREAEAISAREAERQRQQAEAERLAQAQRDAEWRRQAQIEAERRQREQQEAAAERQRQAEAVEQLKKQQEAQRSQAQAQWLWEQQEAARLLRRKKQRENEERAQQEAATTAKPRNSQPIKNHQTGIGRRRTLQLLGLGGGGVVLVSAVSLLSRESTEPKVEQPTEEAPAAEPVEIEPPAAVSSTNPNELSPIEFQTVKVDKQGQVIDRPTAQVQAFQEDLGNGVGLDMVAIPAGEFTMGSPGDEPGRDGDEGPQRKVSVASFFMGRFPITQAQYQAVIGSNPARFSGNGANRPVESVSWNDAVAFCEALSQQTGRTYRLPSEAEWEYACRAGTTTPFAFGPTITPNLANYDGNYSYGDGPTGTYREQTTEVGSFPPNAFGLYDLHGNVWEWCQDVWHSNYEGAPTDGSAWVEGGDQNRRVLRGGSWILYPDVCRSVRRLHYARAFIFNYVGFRVVRVPAG